MDEDLSRASAQRPPSPLRALYRDTIVERYEDRWVDPFLLALIRHHAESGEDRRDILEYCLLPVHTEQLDILLRHIGSGMPLLAHGEMTTDVWEDGKVLTARMNLGDDGEIWWSRRMITLHGYALPQTVAGGAVGRTVREIVTHPYIPEDLVINEIHPATTTTTLIVGADGHLPTGKVG